MVGSFFLNFVYVYFMCECSAHIPAGQKRASYPVIDGCQPPCAAGNIMLRCVTFVDVAFV